MSMGLVPNIHCKVFMILGIRVVVNLVTLPTTEETTTKKIIEIDCIPPENRGQAMVYWIHLTWSGDGLNVQSCTQ